MSAKKLKLDMSVSLRLTVDTRNMSDYKLNSSKFGFQDGRWKLRFHNFGSLYRLSLRKCSGVQPNPLHVSVVVESSGNGRIVNVLSEEKHFTDEFEKEDEWYGIWWKREQEILRTVPEFRLHGVLKLIVVLKLGGEENYRCTCATCQFTAADDIDPSLEIFSKDLGDLLDQNASADVEFRCVDADDNILTIVKAHKLVVCARSPVLASMLNSDMLEGRTGVATIKDIDAGVFKQFLKYLYSGKLDETTVDTAMSLYEAGDRFQVESLTKHCAKWIVRNLTIENSCEVLVLADSHGDEDLAEATLTFMVNRGVPHAFDGWEDFCSNHPGLSVRVLKRFCKLFKGMSPEGESSCAKRRRIE